MAWGTPGWSRGPEKYKEHLPSSHPHKSDWGQERSREVKIIILLLSVNIRGRKYQVSSLFNLLTWLDSGFVVRQCTLHRICIILDYLRKNYWNWCVPSAGPGWPTHCSIGSPTLPPLSDTDMHRKLPLSHWIFICIQAYYCRNYKL